MLDINNQLISKSTVDTETSSVQETDEDSEIENEFRGSTEPEYEVDDVDVVQPEDSE